MRLRTVAILTFGILVVAFFYLARLQKKGETSSLSSPPTATAERALRPRLPAPRIRGVAQPQAEAAPQESRIKKLLKGEWPSEVKLEELEDYLGSNHRNVGSLLAAFRLTSDRELLREAAEKFPADPRVAYESWFRTQDKIERQKWLETWEKSDPDNSLASYLAAANLFKSGNTDSAIQKLEDAAAKSDFSFFARETIVECEEAYKAAGYSDAEARIAATFGLVLPHLAELKAMSQSLGALALAYRQAGDEASAQAIVHMGLQMADRAANDRSSMIENLVSIAVKVNLLNSLDPSAPGTVPGKTVQDLLNDGLARRESLREIGKRSEALLQNLSDEDVAAFCERFKVLGETQANRWLSEKFGAAQDSGTQ